MRTLDPPAFSEVIRIDDFRTHTDRYVFEPDGEVGYEEFDALLQLATRAVYATTLESRRLTTLEAALETTSSLAQTIFDKPPLEVFDLGHSVGITAKPRSANFHDHRAESKIVSNAEGLRFLRLGLALDPTPAEHLERDAASLEIDKEVGSLGVEFELSSQGYERRSYYFSILRGVQAALPSLRSEASLSQYIASDELLVPFSCGEGEFELNLRVDQVNGLGQDGTIFNGEAFYGRVMGRTDDAGRWSKFLNPILHVAGRRVERVPDNYWLGLSRLEDVILRFRQAYELD